MKDFTNADRQSNRQVRKLLVGAIGIGALVGSSSAQATTYYVAPNGSNANVGSITKPWATLLSATNRMHAGDTLYVRGGTYKMTAHDQIIGNGTLSASQGVFAYPGEMPIFDATSVPSGTDAIAITGQNIVVNGLTVMNSPKNGLVDWGGTNVTIQNCVIHDCQQSGILAMYPTNWTVNGLMVNGCTVYNCSLMNAPDVRKSDTTWTCGIQAMLASNVTVKNSTVYHNFGEGVGFDRCKGSTMSNNTAYDNFSVNLYLDNGINCAINSNLVYDTGNTLYYRSGRSATGIQCGIEPNSYSGPIGLSNCAIESNVVVNTYYGFAYGNYGLGGGMQNFTVQNNTFYGAVSCSLYIDADKGHSNNVFTKNIWRQTNSVPMVYAGQTAGILCSSNCWYGGIGVNNYSGAGDVKADPKFSAPGLYNTSGYSLMPGSPCIPAKMGAVTGTTVAI